MTVGERIREARIKKGYSQSELAKLLGYKSRSSINKIEVDGRDIPRSSIVQFAKILGVTPSYLMGWEDDDKQTDKVNPLGKFKISSHEKKLILSYRNKPELQQVIDKLLDIEDNEQTVKKNKLVTVYKAARSDNNKEQDGYTQFTQEQIDSLLNAPETDDDF